MWYKEVLQMARVLIIDPHPVTKEGIKKVILQHTNLEICPDVTTHDESMLSLQKNKPDLIIMEMILKRTDAGEFIREIRSVNKNVKIALFSSCDNAKDISRLIDCGANGYLSKYSSAEDFIKGISHILKQKKYIQEPFSTKVRFDMALQKNEREKLNSLTKREMDILTLVSEGLLNKEIANDLNITERTVKNHLSSIFKKIEVSDRTQAAVFAIKNHVVKI